MALAFGFAAAYSGGCAAAAVPPAIAERAPAEGAAAAIAGEACNHGRDLGSDRAASIRQKRLRAPMRYQTDAATYCVRTYVLAKNLRTHTRYARTYYVRTYYVVRTGCGATCQSKLITL